MRLIDADALLKDIEDLKKSPWYLAGYISDERRLGIKEGLDMISSIIRHSPTSDAEPIKRGKWIVRDNPGTGWYRITCSECGEDVTSTAPCIGFFPNASVTWNYCPECGAKMEAEK